MNILDENVVEEQRQMLADWLIRIKQIGVEIGMRKLISGMKISVDGKMEGPEGVADWVEAWSEDYGLMPQIDACVLGGGMYPGYERYWTAIRNEPDKPLPMTGSLATPAEIEWAASPREPRTMYYRAP